MSLLFPSLVAGPLLLVLGVPILIHLIQLLRHRRVEWAAMDFLMASQKKHRKWIRLKELLLLAARVAALGLLLLMLAQPIVQDQWGRMLGGQDIHHIVLLDDSFSMSDRQDRVRLFDRGKQFVRRLIDKASQQSGRHAITLLRYSRSSSRSGGPAFDWLDIPIDRAFRDGADGVLGPLTPSETAAGPAAAIAAVDRMPEKNPDETRHLYLLSDFRRKDWSEVAALRTALARLGGQDYQIHLVQCTDTVRSNLAVTELGPLRGVSAAGVEMMMGVSVRNYGTADARQVAVRIEEDGHARPTVLFDRIGPGETASQPFRARFPVAGPHTVTALLPTDALDEDNRRFCVVDVPQRIDVLLVDSAPLARDAHFLATALAPGGPVDTGLHPVIRSPSFLKRADRLDAFAAIYLLNMDRLDDAAIDAIEAYARGGGGVAFFLGGRADGHFFTEKLYRGGAGLFPVPLAIPTNLLVDRVEKSPDLIVSDHPIFSIFAGRRNSFLDRVLIQRYFSLPDGWSPPQDDSLRILARLRNGAPLVVEKAFGEGRVVAVLTRASPEDNGMGSWNNWARNNPSFVVTMLELERYLAEHRSAPVPYRVGQPLMLQLDPQQYTAEVRVVGPGKGDRRGGTVVQAQPRDGRLEVAYPMTRRSGFYEAELKQTDGVIERRLYAVNVDPVEGDLQIVARNALTERLAGVPMHLGCVDALIDDDQQIAGFNLSTTILAVLVALLLGEELLSFSANYHPTRERVDR